MKLSTFATTLGAGLLSLVPTISAIPTSLTPRDSGTNLFIGHSIIPEAKITWKTGQDVCYPQNDPNPMPTLGNSIDADPCDVPFSFDGHNLIYKNCGISNVELWETDGAWSKNAVNKVSECCYGYKCNGKLTDHDCPGYMTWPVEIEWQCAYNL